MTRHPEWPNSKQKSTTDAQKQALPPSQHVHARVEDPCKSPNSIGRTDNGEHDLWSVAYRSIRKRSKRDEAGWMPSEYVPRSHKSTNDTVHSVEEARISPLRDLSFSATNSKWRDYPSPVSLDKAYDLLASDFAKDLTPLQAKARARLLDMFHRTESIGHDFVPSL